MSMDEMRRKRQLLEDQRKKKEEEKKRRKAARRKGTSGKTSAGSNLITEMEAVIAGNMKLHITPTHINNILTHIWKLDDYSNDALDTTIANNFETQALQYRLPLDKSMIINQIRSQAYFKPPSEFPIPYTEFKMKWRDYVGENKEIEYKGSRKEFVQLMTNRYKNYWVQSNGNPLPEDVFQLLYRLEREPKAMERIFEYMEANYFSLIKDDTLGQFLRQMRINISKIIKEQLMNLVNTPSPGEKQRKSKKPKNPRNQSNSSNERS
jgi:hypothetical protein